MNVDMPSSTKLESQCEVQNVVNVRYRMSSKLKPAILALEKKQKKGIIVYIYVCII